jgi:hypothetical protein
MGKAKPGMLRAAKDSRRRSIFAPLAAAGRMQ